MYPPSTSSLVTDPASQHTALLLQEAARQRLASRARTASRRGQSSPARRTLWGRLTTVLSAAKRNIRWAPTASPDVR